MDLVPLVILIWVLLGAAVVWTKPGHPDARPTADEADAYNLLRAL